MLKFGLANPNFKGFMVDSAQANWNVVHIVYDFGDAFVKIVDKNKLAYSIGLNRLIDTQNS
jgi:hypothetical protein